MIQSTRDVCKGVILSHQLPDITIPNVLRELLPEPRYLGIPKLIWIPASEKREIGECTMLGIKQFRDHPVDLFGIEREVRLIDGILKTELNFT